MTVLELWHVHTADSKLKMNRRLKLLYSIDPRTAVQSMKAKIFF